MVDTSFFDDYVLQDFKTKVQQYDPTIESQTQFNDALEYFEPEVLEELAEYLKENNIRPNPELKETQKKNLIDAFDSLDTRVREYLLIANQIKELNEDSPDNVILDIYAQLFNFLHDETIGRIEEVIFDLYHVNDLPKDGNCQTYSNYLWKDLFKRDSKNIALGYILHVFKSSLFNLERIPEFIKDHRPADIISLVNRVVYLIYPFLTAAQKNFVIDSIQNEIKRQKQDILENFLQSTYMTERERYIRERFQIPHFTLRELRENEDLFQEQRKAGEVEKPKMTELDITWYPKGELYIEDTIGDGSCFIHSIMNASKSPDYYYLDNDDKRAYVRKLRRALAFTLEEKDDSGIPFYEKTNYVARGEIPEDIYFTNSGRLVYHSGVSDYSLRGLQQYILSRGCSAFLGEEAFELFKVMGIYPIVIREDPTMEEEDEKVYQVVSELIPYSEIKKDQPIVVVNYDGAHYETIQERIKVRGKHKYRSVFTKDDPFIVAIYKSI